MIQRIQSVYLLIVTILMGLMFAFPLSSFMWNGEVFKLYAWGVESASANKELVVNTLYLTILLSLSVLLPFVAIFFFKHRWVQIRMCLVEIVLLAGVQMYVGMYLYKAHVSLEASMLGVFSIIDIFPLICIALVVFAFKRIAKDEALVKSLDRIR